MCRSFLARHMAAVAALAVLSAPVTAQNLLQNPGFEIGPYTGVPTGWLLGPTTPGTCSPSEQPPSNLAAPTGGAHSGAHAADFRQVNCYGSISQTLATVPGQTYAISFWGRSDTGHDVNATSVQDALRIYFGGTQVLFASNLPAVWGQFTTTAVATSASTLFNLQGFNNPEGDWADDLSVTAVGVIDGIVPEPSSLALLGSGLVALVPLMRRRRR